MSFALWLVAGLLLVSCLTQIRAIRRLDRLPAAADPGPRPRVAAIVAARDEAARLPQVAASLLAQRGVELQLVVVDDRSTDATPTVLADLAAATPAVVPVRVDALPAGWLGKPHALHCGAQQARGDWLLFCDADSTLREDVVSRAIALAERDRADHVTLTPGHVPLPFLAEATLLAFHAALARHAARANADHPRGMCGVGAFNLVRATAYRACRGHEPLRLEVIDDVKLGLLVRRTGGRTRVCLGAGDLHSTWGSSPGDLVHVLEKNFFAAFGFSTRIGVPVALLLAAVWLLGLVGPCTGTAAGVAAGLALHAHALPAAWLAARQGWRKAPALAAPLGMGILAWALLRSVALALVRGAIVWRGTRYPLALLRRGVVR